MSTILYGNLRVEIFDDLGARVSRLSMRAANPPQRRPGPAQRAGLAIPPGRDVQLNDAYAAIRALRPIEFTAACGYGKTTLLRHLADNAVYNGASDVSVYLRTGAEDPADIVQRLFAELYLADPPVKPTAEQCAELVRHTRPLIVLDDVQLSPGAVESLAGLLAGCGLVLGSGRPVLGRRGTSQALPGLPDAAALALLTHELGRPLADGELTSARQLVAAVDGQPLHLRQAAALVQETRQSLADLARIAARDASELDRLSVNRLAVQERRALAVLALAGGALLPAELVGAMGDVATIALSLEQLRRRGLAERQADRFGLPVCKVASYRAMVARDVQLATAARAIFDWLASRDPTSADSLSAVGGALAIIEWAADSGDWPVVASLARVAEPVLTLAGRWEASQHVLGLGYQAAKAAADHAAQALFGHQLGTLALCRDELESARRLLTEALRLREQLGDAPGAAVTRQNLALLLPAPAAPPSDPPPPRRDRAGRAGGPGRRALLAGVSLLAVLLVAWIGVRTLAATSPPAKTKATSSISPTPHGNGSTSPDGNGPTTPDGNGPTTPSGGGGASTTPPAVTPTVSPANVGSADISTGSTPASQVVDITNPGTVPLPITSATVSGTGFSATTGNGMCSTTGTTILVSGETCTVTVQFAPTVIGANTGTLTVDYGTDQTDSVQLTGTGYVMLTVSPTGNNISSVSDSALGLSCPGTCSVTIDSTANAPFTLTENPGDGYDFFSWGGACSGASATCDIYATQLTGDLTVSASFSPTTQ